MRRSREARRGDDGAEAGRLRARPGTPGTLGSNGLQTVSSGSGSVPDGLLYVPPSYHPEQPAPLVVMLHGAGGNANHGLLPLQQAADSAGVILFAPDSRQATWDVLYGAFGPDVVVIDRALTHTFEHYAIDPRRVAAAGFSDGASYALSLGITNGDLFTHIIAFSPGFLAPAAQIGRPRIFISHGTRDTVLPIGSCSRRIVPQIDAAGYAVRYREFDGLHTVPPEIVAEALDWFFATS